jgi:proline iminopeptidase
VQVPAAWAFHYYERGLSELVPANATIPTDLRTTGRPPPTAVMEAHYLAHDCFLTPDQLIHSAHRLAGIPGVIVQSRYDLLCPPAAAHRLHAAWPGSQLRFIEAAGHAMSEDGVREAMREGLDTVAASERQDT